METKFRRNKFRGGEQPSTKKHCSAEVKAGKCLHGVKAQYVVRKGDGGENRMGEDKDAASPMLLCHNKSTL